ncbi:MAG TPA: hypothetical protein VHZ33_35675 [Trebonia sp.]|jgi:uncharacterized repeat protein (TIGR01451 family)|nr:hypothetical protein [Trebonia sp.]
MKIWQRSTPARPAAVMAVGLLALPAAMAAGHPVRSHPTAAAHAAAATSAASAARPPRAVGLTVSVSDGHVAARAGDRLTYTIRVGNSGTKAASRVTITQTLSAGLEFVSASPHGADRGGRVSWSARLPVGATRTFLVTALVTRTPATLLRLAAVACVALPGSDRPVVCAAHLDRLPAAAASVPRSTGSGLDLLPYASGGLGLLVLGLLTAIVARRRGRLRRQPA